MSTLSPNCLLLFSDSLKLLCQISLDLPCQRGSPEPHTFMFLANSSTLILPMMSLIRASWVRFKTGFACRFSSQVKQFKEDWSGANATYRLVQKLEQGLGIHL